MNRSLFLTLLLLALTLPLANATDLDLAASKITIHVEKSGLFSAFAHNHIISAPLASGHLDLEKRTIELRFRSQDMKVLDPDISDSDRATIDHTMKSDRVLDPARFPEITFTSTSVELRPGDPSGNLPSAEAGPTAHDQAHGNLTLHGVTRPIEISVSHSGTHYAGKVTLKQSDFNITPIKIAGGSVRVKDPVEIVFDIVTK